MKKSVLIALTLIFASFAASAQVHNYPLKICGVQVSDTNCDNIAGQYISGTVKYVDSTKTLILRGATIGDSIQMFFSPLIQADSSLTIRFEGDNHLIGHRCDPIIDFYDTVKFFSPSNATLKIRHCRCSSSSMEASIRARDINFAADGKISISRDYYMSSTYYRPLIKARDTNRAIRFSNGSVTLKGSASPIANYNSATFDNQYITYPPNTYFDTVNHCLANPVFDLDSVVISDEYTQPYQRLIYPITIAGTPVTVRNADSVGGPGISGHVSYDSLSNKLTLNNVSIFRSNHVGIKCDSSITIQCIGNNIVDGGDYSVLDHSKTALILNGADNVIYGNGTNDTLQLLCYRFHELTTISDLQISDLTLLALVGNGINGDNRHNLTLNNCNAKVMGNMYNGPISSFSNLILNGCRIVQPAGAYYSTTSRCIFDSTGTLISTNDTLVIEKSPVGILQAGKEETELMPNPVSTNLYVVSESVIHQLQVFDTYGRLLKTLSPTTKQAIVNVRDLRNGIYTIIIKSQNAATARQFVVKH